MMAGTCRRAPRGSSGFSGRAPQAPITLAWTLCPWTCQSRLDALRRTGTQSCSHGRRDSRLSRADGSYGAARDSHSRVTREPREGPIKPLYAGLATMIGTSPTGMRGAGRMPNQVEPGTMGGAPPESVSSGGAAAGAQTAHGGPESWAAPPPERWPSRDPPASTRRSTAGPSPGWPSRSSSSASCAAACPSSSTGLAHVLGRRRHRGHRRPAGGLARTSSRTGTKPPVPGHISSPSRLTTVGGVGYAPARGPSSFPRPSSP